MGASNQKRKETRAMVRRAVLYTRVAVGGEGAGKHELDRQLEACRQHAQDQGWEVVAELAEDERRLVGTATAQLHVGHGASRSVRRAGRA